MIKPKKLKIGDRVAVVSLSKGLLGLPSFSHEVNLGIKRLKEFGLDPVFMPNSMKNPDYLFEHPEKRASDLKEAFLDENIKAIICAIGGDDTYKTIPYLMEDAEFVDAVKTCPKIFTGFSDTTNNHLMFSKLGLVTFYGPNFLCDLAELDKEMLPYTKESFSRFFRNDSSYEILSSPVWYNDRVCYGEEQIGIPRVSNKERYGYEVPNGGGKVTGKLYGGCLDSLYNIYESERYKDQYVVFSKYKILPSLDEWKEKILFIETSEEKMAPEKLKKILDYFKEKEILSTVKGIIVGKPMDEVFYSEYKEVYRKIFKDLNTPLMYNVNFGHGVPRCLLPYGLSATVDFSEKSIFIDEPIFEN